MKTGIAVAMTLAFSLGDLATVLGQDTSQTPTATEEQVKFIPAVEPASEATLFKMLDDRQVLEELDLNDDQSEVILKIRKELSNAVSTIARSPTRAMSPLEKRRQLLELFEGRAKAIDELLTPKQAARLRQLAHRREIQVIGYENALTRGRLAEIAGVEGEQIEQIETQATQILAELRSAVESLERLKEEKIVSMLTPEQQSRFRTTVGSPFKYIDRSHENADRSQRWQENINLLKAGN